MKDDIEELGSTSSLSVLEEKLSLKKERILLLETLTNIHSQKIQEFQRDNPHPIFKGNKMDYDKLSEECNYKMINLHYFLESHFTSTYNLEKNEYIQIITNTIYSYSITEIDLI